uniref:Repulsive guidance molecule BMP co-receptor a n=1 Tax=Sphaeramia orbicularis TaxID=375764 RepID=A0A673C735_9TELE
IRMFFSLNISKNVMCACGFGFAETVSCFSLTVSLQCKILKCNSEFWASTSNSGPEEEFCTALRAYNSCVRRTARTCRGDLAYHSAQHGIEDLMSQHNCSKEGPTSQPRDLCHYERSLPRNTSPPNYTHCGFFGDPHLRTFGDEFQTCKVEGAWPLIHNKYLSVQVTNTPVVPGSLATATSKLTIIFKNFQECVDQKMYHAETDELPAAFADGSKNGGDRHGHVEIQARYIGTTIVVRQVGRYLTFAVRMPEEVVNSVEEGDNQDLYLCLHGCPANQRIDFRNFRARAAEAQSAARTRGGSGAHGFTYQSAKAKCKERLPVEDLYFQSCVFDLLSSGDINFTMAAYYAFEDVKMLHSNSKRYHIFEEDMRNAAHAGKDILSLLLLNLLAVLMWMECCTVYL